MQKLYAMLRWKLIKPWLGVASLFGIGFLPCPECGAPLLWHFWPVAAILAWRNLIRQKKAKEAEASALPLNKSCEPPVDTAK